MFIARNKELAILEKELKKDSSAVLVYGKRKIGKTTLILEATKRFSNRTVIYYECIKDTIENNVKRMTGELKRLGLIPAHFAFESNTFDDLFSFLNGTLQKFVVIIDEYCYLKEYENSKKVDSVFQTIIDNKLANINLFISGSHVSMMKDLLTEKNALFGRFSCSLELKELNYIDASLFYEDLTPYEKIGYYSVFGGSPYILSQLDKSRSLKDNIIDLLLNKSNPVFLYVDSLLLTDLNKPSIDRVLGALKNSSRHYKELEDVLDKDRTGNLSKMLKPLIDIGLVKREYPINKMGADKKATYRINDNLIRFYYTYIYPHKFLLETMSSGDYFENFIGESLTEFISRRFEDICRDYIWALANKGLLKGITNVGTYHYDDAKNHVNGEFDLAIEKGGSYDIIEVKYLKTKVNRQTVEKELGQIRQINELSIGKTGFISVNGFEDDVPQLDYMFDGAELYSV